MPILTGLVFAASLNAAIQDDLINDKHYIVVKNGEQGSSTGVATSADQGSFSGSRAEPPILHELPVTIDIAQTAQGARPRLSYTGDLYRVSGLSQLQSMPEYAKLVSCSFVDSNANDVLKWLSKQGVNFAGASDSMPKGKLSLNLKNVPLHEALDAIAEVFGGVWNVRGKTLIFSSGRGTMFSTSPARAVAPQRSRVDPKRPYELLVPPVGVEGFQFKFDEKMIKDLAQIQDVEIKLSDKELAKAHEEIARAHAEMQKAFTDKDRALMREDLAKAQAEMKRSMDIMREKDGRLKLTVGASSENFGKLMKSLTDKQWELHKKQGFLNFSDLTKEQIKMVSPDGKVEGKMTINVNIDGKSLTIKN